MSRSWIGLNFLAVLCLLMLSGCSRAVSDDPQASDSERRLFTDVTERAGLAQFSHRTGAAGDKWFLETMGAGGGFIDYDGDAWSDILLVGGGSWSGDDQIPALRLYRNNGDGTFTEVTEAAGFARIRAYGFGIAVADYDNDGDDDVFLTTLHGNLLFENRGGRFVERAAEAGVAGASVWSTSATFFDANRDGHLDLFVGNYVVWSPEKDIFCTVDGRTKAYCQPTLYEGISGRFYLNDGDGTFTDASAAAGFEGAPGKTLGVIEVDYNEDGWPDLVVANDTERDLLFENRGDGSFAEKGVLAGIAFDVDGRARGGMGIDAGVVDDTGRESIFVGNFSNEMIGVYKNRGNGSFEDRAAVSKIGRPSLRQVTFGLFLLDVDLDGDLDVFAANGNIREENDAQDGVPYRQRAQLFLNAADGTFIEHEPAAGDALAQALVGRGAAYADYDRDGDLDILVTENGGPARLWRNESAGSNALRVHVRGRETNEDGLGTRVRIRLGDTWMHRRVRGGGSYLSHSETVATFGLGAAEQVDSLVVAWPSGRVDRYAHVKAPAEIRVVEGEGRYEQIFDHSDLAHAGR